MVAQRTGGIKCLQENEGKRGRSPKTKIETTENLRSEVLPSSCLAPKNSTGQEPPFPDLF